MKNLVRKDMSWVTPRFLAETLQRCHETGNTGCASSLEEGEQKGQGRSKSSI